MASNNIGKTFEQEFKECVPPDYYLYRLKDDTSGFYGVSNPCDYILFRSPYCEYFVTKKSKEESRCKDYVGVTCVNGGCPNAMADEYPEYGYEHCTCEECGYYKGCEDCALAGTEHCNKAPTGGGKDGTE